MPPRPERTRLALDQSVPTPVVNSLDRFLPEVQLVPLRRIDNRLSALDDRELVLALHQLGWAGLVTTNDRMLHVPDLLAALLRTGLTALVIEGVDDDPLAAVGALLQGLPAVRDWLPRARPRPATGTEGGLREQEVHVLRLGPRRPTRAAVIDLLHQAATRQRRDPESLFHEVAVGDEELTTPVLAPRFGGV
jgi:hypothetical protein